MFSYKYIINVPLTVTMPALTETMPAKAKYLSRLQFNSHNKHNKYDAGYNILIND